jgi:MFS family permease
VSSIISPISGRVMDRSGPRVLILVGVAVVTAGLMLARQIANPWHFYVLLGMAVGAGANLMSFTVHSQFLPNWFARKRAMAIGIAFSGVGVGAIVLLPWLQSIIVREGWREACFTMGIVVLCVLGPLNLLVWRKPEDIGLLPDGDKVASAQAKRNAGNVVDAKWAGTAWTLSTAARTARFWWIVIGFFSALFAWYAVQVHQTKYLVEIGFSPTLAAWSLGIVSVVAIPGQIGLGWLSDRTGREAIWAVGCIGFAICYALLMVMEHEPSAVLLYLMVFAQGFLGYALTSVMGPIVVEIFEGPHFASIFGMINVASIAGGAAGPWVAGIIHDATGSYRLAFIMALGFSVLSAVAIYLASPGKVRVVPGKLKRA